MTLHRDTTWPDLADAVLTHDLPTQRHGWTPEPTGYVGRHWAPATFERAEIIRYVPRHSVTHERLVAAFEGRSGR